MNKILKIITVFLLLICALKSANAGGVSKGFEALKIHDYFKAKTIFYKALKKEAAAAAYGLSVIYSRNNNPFYNLDSALHYAKISTTAFWTTTSEKYKIKYAVYKVDTNSVCKQRDIVDEKCFVFAQEINTVKVYNYFIKNNIGAVKIEEATSNRNKLAYGSSKKMNTSSSYKDFINTYPKAKQIAEANARYEKQLFKEYTINRTLKSNVKFVKEQPNSFYVAEAQENIYKIATKNKTVNAYYSFVKTYSKNPSVPKAWRNIYNISTQVHTSKNIKNFLNQFPNYPFKEELKEDYILANTTYYVIKTNNKWGFVNEELKTVIAPIYSWASDFYEGAAAVMLNNKVGFINKNKTTVIPFKYDEAEPFVNGLAIVGKADKYGIINRAGEIIVPIIYDEVEAFMDDEVIFDNGSGLFHGYNDDPKVKVKLDNRTF
ncbi:MAG: WG repeat-containing protein, partial [Flavobacteriales bacterium]|nr:WG repeat-containing protein [Flavobacteriales bacterium]